MSNATRTVVVYEELCVLGPPPGLPPAESHHLLQQGRAMRDAMLADLAALPHVNTACVDSQALPVPPGVASRALPPHTRPAEHLRRQAKQGAIVWAVAPETDGALEALARAVPAGSWLGCTADAIALATGKSATTRHLAALGLPVPHNTPAPAHRWIVKPEDGAGAVDTRLHTTLAAAQADASGRSGPSTLEPWIDGDALSLSLACRPGQAPRLLAVNRQHLQVDPDGRLHFEGVTPAALPLQGAQGRALQALAERLARAVPGLAGYVGVDLVWHPQHGPVVIELNPRLTTAYVGLSAALGFNVAALLLQALPG